MFNVNALIFTLQNFVLKINNLSLSDLNYFIWKKNWELKFYYFEDASSLTLGTEDGYKIYSLTSTDKLDLVYSNQEKEVGFIQTRRRR